MTSIKGRLAALIALPLFVLLFIIGQITVAVRNCAEWVVYFGHRIVGNENYGDITAETKESISFALRVIRHGK